MMAPEKCDCKLSAWKKKQKAAREPGRRYLRAIKSSALAWAGKAGGQ